MTDHGTKHCADDYPERDEYGRAFRWEVDYARMAHERVYAPPASMVRDLQRAIVGYSYATPYSPADEWAHLLAMVRNRDLPEIRDECDATSHRPANERGDEH